jgi:DNA processing protein
MRPRTLRLHDADYPALLRRLGRPPAQLFVDGSLEGLERAVAIVGTRHASPDALDLAHALAHDLAARGVVVVSGGAEGVDAAAHEGALSAPGGRTVAVLPTPLEAPYPRSHAPLFDRIAARGARTSEHARGTSTHVAHFVQRNRIIAAFARAVVLVQAPHDSGALATADAADALAIPVLAMPWSLGEARGRGSNDRLARGARLCRGAGDVLAAIGEEVPPPPRRRAKRSAIDSVIDRDARVLLDALDHRALDRDALASRTGLPAPRLQAAVVHLLLEGLVSEDAHGVRRALQG